MSYSILDQSKEKKSIFVPDLMKSDIALIITIVCVLLFFIFGMINLVFAKYTAGISELSAGAFLGVFNLYWLLKKKRYDSPILFISLLTILLVSYLYWNGGFAHTGIFWSLAFLGLIYSLHGTVRGGFWILAHLLTLGILYSLSYLDVISVAYTGAETLSCLVVYTFSCFILYNYEHTKEKDKKDLSALTGLLPVCANCKDIRGKDGTWHSIDAYLNENTDIDISHSICPNCIKKLYPEFVGKEMNRRTK